MAKAGTKFNTWILLSEAKARADSAYQSPEFAERQLTKWLLARELPWRSKQLEGSKRDCDPGSGDPEFWREPVPPPQAPGELLVVPDLQPFLIITWDKSCARRRRDYTDSYTLYRIEVAAEYLERLLPRDDADADGDDTRVASSGRDGPAIRRIKQALPTLFPPNGRVPDHVATAKVRARIEAECGWKAGYDSVARALGRRDD
jgi:hypothetical protein